MSLVFLFLLGQSYSAKKLKITLAYSTTGPTPYLPKAVISFAIHNPTADAAKYVDRVPRVEPEAVAVTLEFMGKKGFPVENFADNAIIDRLVREGFIDQLYKKR